MSDGLGQARGQQRRQGQDRRRGVAARHGDPAGSPDPGPRRGQLGQAVVPLAGVRAGVEPGPRGGVGEPEVRAQVNDLHRAGQLRGQRRGLPGGQGKEDQVGGRQRRGGGRHENAARQPGEMGVHVGHRPARARPGRDGADLDVGVRGQQTQQLPACVAAGPGHRDPRAHGISLTIAAVSTRPCSRAADCYLRKYAALWLIMQMDMLAERGSGATGSGPWRPGRTAA